MFKGNSSPLALAFDVDKTLTNRWKQIDPRTKETVKKLRSRQSSSVANQGDESGLHLFVCTGRGFPQATEALQLFNSEAIHILNGGGRIVTGSGEVLFERLLPSDLVKEITKVAIETGSQFEFDHEGEVFVSPDKLGQSISYRDARQLDNWSTTLLCVQQINQKFVAQLYRWPGLTIKEMVSEVNGPYVDITLAEVNKATGLQKWSELTKIPLDRVVGFGDGYNDIEFLKIVGWGVAMGNAPTELKQVADEVIGDCDSDALAEYLEANFLHN